MQISLDWQPASHLVKLSCATKLYKCLRIIENLRTNSECSLSMQSFILHRSGLCLLLGGCFAQCFLAESVVFLEI